MDAGTTPPYLFDWLPRAGIHALRHAGVGLTVIASVAKVFVWQCNQLTIAFMAKRSSGVEAGGRLVRRPCTRTGHRRAGDRIRGKGSAGAGAD